MPRRPIPVNSIELVREGCGDARARRYAVAALRHAVERVAAARVGVRNTTLNREAFSVARLLGAELRTAELTDALIVAAEIAGLSTREARATIASALRGRAGR
jgi:hypothetical protein